MEKHKGNECVLPRIRNSWSIHGIWPTKYHTIGPLYCNDTWTFDMKQIEPIEDEMKEKWINIEKNTALDGLWKHEWEKHGTCAATQVASFNTEFNYFKGGLNLFNQYSITKLLSQTYIQPGLDVSYTVEEIHSTLSLAIGNNFAIICERDHDTKQQFLFEIRICFDKQLNIHSCDGIVMEGDTDLNDKIITNCRKDQEIVYPSSYWLVKRQYLEKFKEKENQNKGFMYNIVNFYKLVRLLQWITL